MSKLRHPSDVPPCGWQYLEPRTRLTLKGDNLADLVSHVHTHRQHNGFPDSLEQARLDVQRQICSKLGTRECVPEGPDDPWKPVHDLTRTASVTEILAFSRAALDWLMGGREIVPLEVNEARRKTCAACPMNQPVQGCRCAPLYRMVDRAIPEDRRFGDLHVCGVCGCSLKAKCAVPASVVAASDEGRDLPYPVGCWVPSVLQTTVPEVKGEQ